VIRDSSLAPECFVLPRSIPLEVHQFPPNPQIRGVANRLGTQNLARLFDTYLNELAQKCADATVENWKARLAGVEVWTSRHCQQIINALRVD
jgi:hypothetical protein